MIHDAQLLLAARVDINMLAALQGAVKKQHVLVAEFLLSDWADVNGRTVSAMGSRYCSRLSLLYPCHSFSCFVEGSPCECSAGCGTGANGILSYAP